MYHVVQIHIVQAVRNVVLLVLFGAFVTNAVQIQIALQVTAVFLLHTVAKVAAVVVQRTKSV